MAKNAESSPLLSRIHQLAHGMHASGTIDAQRLRQYELLCRPVPEYSSEDIRTIRARLEFNQVMFAQILNTSVSTVRQWEQGKKKPSGIALKLLHILDTKGLDVLL